MKKMLGPSFLDPVLGPVYTDHTFEINVLYDFPFWLIGGRVLFIWVMC